MFRFCVTCRRTGGGIVGLPNCGKSTLFNAITCSQQAKVGNFPFCTIDANLAKVSVYDRALAACAAFAGSKKTYPPEIDLADVAGLIKGASQGLGLGNKFLADIRPVTVILHMVRCFESQKEGFDTPTPLDAIATIDAELILSDLETVEKRVAKNKRTGGGGSGAASAAKFDEAAFAKQVLAHLEDGKPARDLPSIQQPDNNSSSDKQRAYTQKCTEALATMQLLSAKPTLFVLNVDEDSMTGDGNEFSRAVEASVGAERCVRVCALIEEQCAQLASREERLELLSGYGIEKEPAVEVLLRRVFDMLKLQSFYTVGPQMAKAWPIKQGTTAREAAGEIHGDFEKHFTAARVLPYSQFISHGNLRTAEARLREVPQSYVMEPGDVMVVEHSAKRK